MSRLSKSIRGFSMEKAPSMEAQKARFRQVESFAAENAAVLAAAVASDRHILAEISSKMGADVVKLHSGVLAGPVRKLRR